MTPDEQLIEDLLVAAYDVQNIDDGLSEGYYISIDRVQSAAQKLNRLKLIILEKLSKKEII